MLLSRSLCDSLKRRHDETSGFISYGTRRVEEKKLYIRKYNRDLKPLCPSGQQELSEHGVETKSTRGGPICGNVSPNNVHLSGWRSGPSKTLASQNSLAVNNCMTLFRVNSYPPWVLGSSFVNENVSGVFSNTNGLLYSTCLEIAVGKWIMR